MKNLLITGLFFGILFSLTTESSAQWAAVDSGLTNLAVISFAVVPYGAGGTDLIAATDGGIFLSTNYGTSWNVFESMNKGACGLAVSSNGAGGANLFAASDEVLLSTFNGTNWTSWTTVSSGLKDAFIWTLATSPDGIGGTNLFVGTWRNGVYLLTYNGTTWTSCKPVNSGLTHLKINALALTPNGDNGINLFAATEGGGIFLSTNNGTSWSPVNSGLTDTSFFALYANGSNLFAGSYLGHVFLSTDNGTNWTQHESPNTYVTSFAVSGTNIFAGTWGRGVFISTDNGAHWTNVHTSNMYPWVWSLAVTPDGAGGTYLFAGTEGGGAWRRPLSEMITPVEHMDTPLPMKFGLYQNFPNPFNPLTTISFSLPSKSFVSLKIYDMQGREVATLVSEEMSAGHYSRPWNATSISSGIYFYRLSAVSSERQDIFSTNGRDGQTGPYLAIKKLVLLR